MISASAGTAGHHPADAGLDQIDGFDAGPATRPLLTAVPTPGVPRPLRDPQRAAAVLDVVLPVHNEQDDLERCVRRLHAYLRDGFPYSYRITIADNASTDATPVIARRLARQIREVVAVRLEDKGRGRALREVWSASDAAVLAYMDVDLSTDLAGLLPLVAPLLSGHSDLAIGTRLARGSRVVRGPKREIISRCYNLILRASLATGFTDAQCGFKAIRADVAHRLLPLVEDTGWFFDTELLVLAERAGARIHEVPVDWVDDADSRVELIPTAIADLRGIARLGRALATGRLPLTQLHPAGAPGAAAVPVGSALPGARPAVTLVPAVPGVSPGLTRQVISFAAVGVASTLAYLVLYVVLRTGMEAQAANLIALLTTAIGNTAANRRLTFGVTGRTGVVRHQIQGLVVFVLALGLTGGALAALHLATPAPARWLEILVLTLANAAATLMRFLLLRIWVFRRRSHGGSPVTAAVPR
jgi:putative flippase GtrA